MLCGILILLRARVWTTVSALVFEDDNENDDDDENLAPTRRLESVTNKL